MRIGIDFDDTLTDTFSVYLKYFNKWDESKRFKDIYNMNSKDWDLFYDLFWDDIYKEVIFFPEVKECLTKLKEMGHTLVLMSARFGPCTDFAINQIKEENLPIDEFVFTKETKSDECIKHKIDLMIDDSESVIDDLRKHHIKYIKKGKSHKYKHIDSWYDIIKYIEKEA